MIEANISCLIGPLNRYLHLYTSRHQRYESKYTHFFKNFKSLNVVKLRAKNIEPFNFKNLQSRCIQTYILKNEVQATDHISGNMRLLTLQDNPLKGMEKAIKNERLVLREEESQLEY